MAGKMHITDDGPKRCEADVRTCKWAEGGHFDTPEQAEEQYAKNMEKKTGIFSGLKKDANDPDTAHVKTIEKLLADAEDDMKARDARQGTGTAYSQLRGQFGEEAFAQMADVQPTLSQGGLGSLNEASYGDPVMGVSFVPNMETTENMAMEEIGKRLEDGHFGKDDVQYAEHQGQGVFMVRGNSSGDDVRLRTANQALLKYRNYQDPAERNSIDRLERKYQNTTFNELRNDFKGKISPMPRKRDDLIKEIHYLENGRPEPKPTPPAADFGRGSYLSIVSDNPVMMATMRKAKEAHDNGTLRVGVMDRDGSRDQGYVFYDDRDMSREDRTRQIKAKAVEEAAINRVSGTVDDLKSNGSLYAIQSNLGSNVENLGDAKYFINYYPKKKPDGIRNGVSGWFSRDELASIAEGDFSEVVKREEDRKAKYARG